METMTRDARAEWIDWLSGYGIGAFYDAFLRNAQDAQSRCVNCDEPIYLDIVEGGGVPDWGSDPVWRNGKMIGLDYGCNDSPDTGDDGVGSHEPERIGR